MGFYIILKGRSIYFDTRWASDRAEILLQKLKNPARSSLTWLNKKSFYFTFIQK